MDLGVEMTEGQSKTVHRAQLIGILEESMVNVDITVIEIQDEIKNQVHKYKSGKDVYLKYNESPWVKETETNNEHSQSATSYSNVAKSLDSIQTLVEVVETVDSYEVKYAGSGSEEIYKAFKKPFNLIMDGIDIEQDSKMDLLFIIDKESNRIQDIDFEITAEKDGIDYLISTDIKYNNINNTTVDIPEEVIEEAR